MYNSTQFKISVIVPVYNVEEFLDRCVESLVQQTHKNLEIILVDDGSPDTCPQICDAWAQRDCRIRVVHKENGGVSSARNAGLDMANGDYIAFVDGDDYLSNDMYEKMLAEIVDYGADCAACGMVRESANGYKEVWGRDCITVLDRLAVLQWIGEASGILPVHTGNKLFSKDTIGNIRFDTRFRYAEDTLFNFEVARNINKMVLHGLPRYHYINNAASVSHQTFIMAKFDEHKVMDILFNYAKGDCRLMPYCVKGDVQKSFRTIKEMSVSGNHTEYFGEIRERIVSHRREILKEDKYDKATKFKTILLWLFPDLYKTIIKFYGMYANRKYNKLTGME